jgi:hypothetical protein
LNNIDYLGYVRIHYNDAYSEWHYNKCYDIKHNIPYLIKKSQYASGPLYYLSINAVSIFNKTSKNEFLFYEDTMVSYYLNQANIFPLDYQIYNNDYCYEKSCMQNIDKYHNLFIQLRGGLGNQLFQVASAYGIAKKHKMNLVLLYNNDYKSILTHNRYIDEFMKTIFDYFNYTIFENIDLSNEFVTIYEETNCFDYDSSIIKENNKDYLLKGFFQNKRYFQEYKTEIIDIFNIFKNNNISNHLFETYNLLDKSYFIHIRRGDYVNHWLYEFNCDDYYTKAINYILNIDNDCHFYIVSDDIEFCKRYPILNTINKTYVEDVSTLETIYLISLCAKGGICCNSTFSGWGSNLNSNKNKIVIGPKQWINIDTPYEIPFDFTEII